jgi:hypothetical protein
VLDKVVEERLEAGGLNQLARTLLAAPRRAGLG